MTTSFITTNTIGAGIQFTFAASGNSLVVLQNVTLGSTNGAAISPAGFSDLEISVLGTMVGSSQITLGPNCSFTLGKTGTFLSFGATMSLAGLYLNGASGSTQIDGTFSAPESIGLLTAGGNQAIFVTGSITAASAVYLQSNGLAGDVLVNSGQIQSTTAGDIANNTFFNNAIFVEGPNARITNLVGGSISATGSEANGVRAYATSTGLVLTNHGTITSVNSAAVDLVSLGFGGTASLINTGVVKGGTQSFNGLGSAGTFTILNSGQLTGSVVLGLGNDQFDGRGGRIDGNWSGFAGNDRYDGRGASLITGQILGGLGNDTLLGGDGDETIYGEDNLDTLIGGGGDDQLFGGFNSDYLVGGEGNDGLEGGADFDDMSGGAGDDTLQGNDGGMIGYGGAGNDGLFVDTFATANFVAGYGGSGDDYFQGGLIRDNIYGGRDDDEIYSGDGDDFVFGGAGDDTLDAFDGLDTVYGGAGDDLIVNVAGASQLFGGRGHDSLSGNGDADFLDGGADDDTLDGGSGADTLFGDTGNDQINGGSENDQIDGGTGADVLQGGGGGDRVNGGTGDDDLMGEAGNDTMSAGAGDDTLTGGQGRDSLTGGTGADHFALTVLSDTGILASTRDILTDFQTQVDRFDLSAPDANSGLAGNQAFTYIAGAVFGNVAGQLRYSATTGLMEGDVNGDGLADFVVEFQNLTALVGADLVL